MDGSSHGRFIYNQDANQREGTMNIRTKLFVAAAITAVSAAGVIAAEALSGAGKLMRVTTSKYPGKVHILPATLETTQWGWFDNAELPRLTVDSGDTVVVETMAHSHGQLWPGKTIEEIKKLRTDWPGRGPMTLTGPIAVNGAQPGDVLKIRINKIVARPWGANFNVPGMFGQFPNEFPQGQVRYMYLDWDRKVAEFAPGVEVPLRPFPGTLGVARREPGRYNAVPPGPFAGNLDNRDLVEGTTLYVPVFVPGALVWTGDSHAAQGNGEVNLTAIETAFQEMSITMTVDKSMKLDMPRIETPTDWITMGYDEDLNKALEQAKAETAKLLAELRHISVGEAAKLAPQVADCRVTQVVDIKKGVHCIVPKDAARRLTEQRPSAETREYLVTAETNADMNKAIDAASWNMIALLERGRSMTRLDAYGLASVAMDCRVGEMTAPQKSVHCVVPKSLWVKR
jgi:acetamidase/formamidase